MRPALPLDLALCRELIEGPDWNPVRQANGCLWLPSKPSAQGYARVTIDGKQRMATRVLMTAILGAQIAPGLVVDHLCHNPEECVEGPPCRHRRCVEPTHLEVVPDAVNINRGAGTGRNDGTGVCPRGHQRVGTCAACRNENNKANGRLVRDAARKLGMTFPEYVVAHGQSKATALGFLAD